jgi:hypothetical protein
VQVTARLFAAGTALQRKGARVATLAVVVSGGKAPTVWTSARRAFMQLAVEVSRLEPIAGRARGHGLAPGRMPGTVDFDAAEASLSVRRTALGVV